MRALHLSGKAGIFRRILENYRHFQNEELRAALTRKILRAVSFGHESAAFPG